MTCGDGVSYTLRSGFDSVLSINTCETNETWGGNGTVLLSVC